MVTLEEVKKWVAGWANNTFWQRAHFLSYWSGTAGAHRPIRTNSSGYVDPSFYDLSDPTITVQDGNFTLVDDGDNTKKVQFQLSGITTATTRTITVPDANFTLMGVSVAQSPQNKTYDSTNISSLTAKTTPVNADSAVIVDSDASNVFKRVTWSNILSSITAYYNSVVATLTNKSIDASANTLTNVNTSALSNDAVSNDKLANMAQSTLKGRASGAGAGDPTDLTAAQAAAILDGQILILKNENTPTQTTLGDLRWDNVQHYLVGGTGSGKVIFPQLASNPIWTGNHEFDGEVRIDGTVMDDVAITSGKEIAWGSGVRRVGYDLGGISSGVTTTYTVTLTYAVARVQYVTDIMLTMGSGASVNRWGTFSRRVTWRTGNSVGNNGIIMVNTDLGTASGSEINFSAITAITNGIQFTAAVTTGGTDSSRDYLLLDIVGNAGLTVSVTVS